MLDVGVIDTTRPNCGAADRDGTTCRQNSGLSAP